MEKVLIGGHEYLKISGQVDSGLDDTYIKISRIESIQFNSDDEQVDLYVIGSDTPYGTNAQMAEVLSALNSEVK